ncbi:HYC_CC_PP family protein [Runella zeae]|jgi:hypothetical protein|uniref:HYC_CC_PP family protein n=1 Tax=Runella zeae TaxID=94255 RepID=UPI00048ABE7E|nr:hypothetical protein [Runella zeae]
MKHTFRKYFTIFMALVLLTASTGFGVIEHHCMMRGKSLHLAAINQHPSDSCQHSSRKAAISAQAAIQKQDCCEEVRSYENVEVSSSLIQWIAKFLQVATDAVIGALVAVFQALAELLFPSASSALSSSFSSIFHGRSLLVFVQSFLI